MEDGGRDVGLEKGAVLAVRIVRWLGREERGWRITRYL